MRGFVIPDTEPGDDDLVDEPFADDETEEV